MLSNVNKFQDMYMYIEINIVKGIVAQLVRAPPCHGGGCEFESRRSRLDNKCYSRLEVKNS